MNRKWFVADFETTTEQYYIENNYTKVWLYAICDSNALIINHGSSIEEFMTAIKKLPNTIIYFHNLRFDGNFIIDYLLNSGFEYKEDLKVHDDIGFSTLIGDMGQFYSIKINFTKSNQIIIEDSMKLLPFSVDKIAKDFKLPILKEHIDYNDYTIDAKRLEYVYHDVRIVAMGLNVLKGQNLNKMTAASCAYSRFTSIYDRDYLSRALPDLGKDFLLEWRNAYRGGRSQVNPRYAEKELHNVYRYDINSMYPWVMHDCLLPYGEPIICSKPNTYAFELYDIDVSFKPKRNHLPSLLKKGNFYKLDGTYYEDSEGIINLKISSIDLYLLQRNYDVEYLKYNKIYGFRCTKLLFNEYVDYYYNKKATSTGALRSIYKLMLNSLYGKFGSNCESYHKIPYLKDGVVSFNNSEKEDMKHYYLPLAIAITSYAHLKLDDGIQTAGINNFVYCDTDSIHTLSKFPDDIVDKTKLGYYKCEALEERSKYIRQKCYITQSKDDIKEDNPTGVNITCAGMPQNIKQMVIDKYKDRVFSEFKKGLTIGGKLLPKHVKGGIILCETTFEIKQ